MTKWFQASAWLAHAILFILIGLPVTPAGAAARELPAVIAALHARQRFPLDRLSLIVQAVDSDQPLVEFNTDVPRNPASVIKLVTTWAALTELGPVFTWKTEAYLLGTRRGGVLEGDLGLKGYGDPALVTEEFWRFLSALRRQGLREIRGDLVIDGSYFDLPPEDPGAFDNQPDRAYNVLPHALLVNFQTVHFEVIPGPGRASILLDPEPANLKVDNGVQVSDARCGPQAAGVGFSVRDPGPRTHVRIAGPLPRGCGAQAFNRAVLTAESYAYGVFKTIWEQLGGTITGSYRSERIATTRSPFLSWVSPTLAEVMRGLNKFSNNTQARHFLLTLGAEMDKPPATVEKGQAAIAKILTARGLDPSFLDIANGSGLARETRITARLLNDILRAAWRAPTMPEFVASLPIVGLDGTMRRRLRGRPESGRMHIKSGHLRGVSAAAGYVHARDGRVYTVVSILNHEGPPYGIGEQIHELVLRGTYNHTLVRDAAARN